MSACVGWPTTPGEPCPVFDGQFHGCALPDGHHGRHVCGCHAQRAPLRDRASINHGTHPGYVTHLRRGEEPCGACKQAHAVYRQIRLKAAAA